MKSTDVIALSKHCNKCRRMRTTGACSRGNVPPLYHEAVSLPVVRDRLKWDENNNTFTNAETLAHYYELITPRDPAETGTEDPKITTYIQVRELRSVLPNIKAKRMLLDPSRSFFDAVSIAKREELSRSWVSQVTAAITSLESMGIGELKSLSQEDIAEINKLVAAAKDLLDSHKKLTG